MVLCNQQPFTLLFPTTVLDIVVDIVVGAAASTAV
jgi:hypothetical protein